MDTAHTPSPVYLPWRSQFCELTTTAQITIRGARLHNLKNVTLAIPKNQLVVLTGMSGSGKSSLVFDILDRAIRQRLYGSGAAPGEHDAIEGYEYLEMIVGKDWR